MFSFNNRISISATLVCCALAAFVLSATAAPARADDQGASYDVGVARISALNGSASIKRGDSGDTVAAMINAPLNVGDYITTYSAARAELQLSSSDFVRVDAETQLRFTSLGSQANSLQLAQGTVEARSLQSADSMPSVQTPSVTIRPNTAGSYRVEVTPEGDTLLAVRSGNADVVAAQNTQTIYAGSTVSIGPSSNSQISLIPNLSRDAFDDWNANRDRYLAAASRDPYADSGIVGLADMDSYGRWVDYPQYGQVWVANSYPVGWAPYRYGRWAWEPYYGWTWIGYEPWGWAPYHYGRWFYAANLGWAWYPGPVYVRPVYQPALVAFFGFGGGFSVSFSFGNVCWTPLAPYEPYYPWYGQRYVNNNTVVYNNYTNITNIYKNAGERDGVDVVKHDDFENGGKYHYENVHSDDLHDVALVRGTLPVVPTRENLHFNNRENERELEPMRVSSHFADLPKPEHLPPTFEQQRTTVEDATRHVKVTNGNNERSQTFMTPPHVEKGTSGTVMTPPHIISRVPQNNSPWDRFNNSGQQSGGTTMHAPHIVNRSVDAPVASNQAANGDGHTNIISHSSNSPWDRFNGANQTSALPRSETHRGQTNTSGYNRSTSGSNGYSRSTGYNARGSNTVQNGYVTGGQSSSYSNGYSRGNSNYVSRGYQGQNNGTAHTYSGQYSNSNATNANAARSGSHESNRSSGSSHENGGHKGGG